MRRAVGVAAGLAAAGLVLAGCASSDSASHGGHMDDAASVSTTADPVDAMFAQMMIPHHEQAVQMAGLAPDRASDPFIKDIAAEILAAQQPEIDQMVAWLEEWGVPRQTMDEAMEAHAGHGMSGMLSDTQMQNMREATGGVFDRLFAEGMIEHHEGAIEMARSVENSANPEVAALAAEIIAAQEDEIEQMQMFLANR